MMKLLATTIERYTTLDRQPPSSKLRKKCVSQSMRGVSVAILLSFSLAVCTASQDSKTAKQLRKNGWREVHTPNGYSHCDCDPKRRAQIIRWKQDVCDGKSVKAGEQCIKHLYSVWSVKLEPDYMCIVCNQMSEERRPRGPHEKCAVLWDYWKRSRGKSHRYPKGRCSKKGCPSTIPKMYTKCNECDWSSKKDLMNKDICPKCARKNAGYLQVTTDELCCDNRDHRKDDDKWIPPRYECTTRDCGYLAGTCVPLIEIERSELTALEEVNNIIQVAAATGSDTHLEDAATKSYTYRLGLCPKCSSRDSLASDTLVPFVPRPPSDRQLRETAAELILQSNLKNPGFPRIRRLGELSPHRAQGDAIGFPEACAMFAGLSVMLLLGRYLLSAFRRFWECTKPEDRFE